MCSFCDIVNKEPDLFDENESNRFIKGVYNGNINLRNLDVKSYLDVADKLTEGVYKGYGSNLSTTLYLSEDYKMLYSLRDNVFIFSGAKQYQQVRQMSSLLTDNGKIVPFNEFKKQAKTVFDDYNKNYLNAEYNSAIAQSRTASQWQGIERTKGLFPYLQYQTAQDGRVRPEHAALNKIIKRVDDPFWSNYMPPNGWNCRCDVTQLDEGTVTNTENLVVENVPDAFKFNAGKEKIVFSKEHPYFDVAARDKNFAKTNFGLPLPSESAKVPVKNYEQEQKKWETNLKEYDKNTLESYTGTDYASLNYYLRNGKTATSTSAEVWDKFSDEISTVLKDAPKFEGTTYRGLNLNDKTKAELLNSIKKDSLFTDKAFLSSSKKESVAIDGFGSSKDGILIEIKSKNGVDISNFSRIKGEEEVLFNKNSKFKVIDIITDNNKTRILLKEL